ncbi:ATPase, AAA-type, core, P-loop containing nucleoside triphosphate hydrolase [Tanacetum coccineum]
MDGFYKDDNVVLIAATNIPKKLDPDLLRRFTTKVVVGVPDQEEIAEESEGLADHRGFCSELITKCSNNFVVFLEAEFVTLDDVRHALDKAEQNNQFVRKSKRKNFLKFLRSP